MEEKKYEIVGKVEIGTDEYRDLIFDKFQAEAEKDRYMRQCWERDSQINELKKKVETLSNEISKYKKFIKDHCTLNSEDSITLFFSGE